MRLIMLTMSIMSGVIVFCLLSGAVALAQEAIPGALPADGVWPVEDTVREVNLDAADAAEAGDQQTEQAQNATGDSGESKEEQASSDKKDADKQEVVTNPQGETPPPLPEEEETVSTWQAMLREIQGQSVEVEETAPAADEQAPEQGGDQSVDEAFNYGPDAEAKAMAEEEAARQKQIEKEIQAVEEMEAAQVESFQDELIQEEIGSESGQGESEEWYPPQSNTSSIQSSSGIKRQSGINRTSGIQSKSGID